MKIGGAAPRLCLNFAGEGACDPQLPSNYARGFPSMSAATCESVMG